MIKRAVSYQSAHFSELCWRQNPHTPLLCDRRRIIFAPGILCYSRGPHGLLFQWGEETWQPSVFKTLPEICSRAPALQPHWQTAITILTFLKQLPLERNPNKCCYSQPNNILLEVGRSRLASAVWLFFSEHQITWKREALALYRYWLREEPDPNKILEVLNLPPNHTQPAKRKVFIVELTVKDYFLHSY